MWRIENRLEMFRGQIEELQGKMQVALGQLEGPRGIPTILSGRGLEMRGKARQAMAQARMGAADFSETLAKNPESFAPYIGLFAFGLTVASLAIFAPQTFSRIWDWIRRPIEQATEQMTSGTTETGAGTETGQRTGFGTYPGSRY